MMTTNLFVIANVNQLRTGCSFRILLPFFRTSWGVGFLNSAIFNSFRGRVQFGMILEGLRNFGIPLESDENIVSVTWRPKYIHVNSSTKYFVARQLCKGNPFLHFFGNTQQFYIVDSDICSPAVPSELVAFPWQEWLHKWATVFHYTYIFYLVT